MAQDDLDGLLMLGLLGAAGWLLFGQQAQAATTGTTGYGSAGTDAWGSNGTGGSPTQGTSGSVPNESTAGTSDAAGGASGPYASYINAAAASYGVPAAIIQSTINVESSGNPDAVSPKGAIGLMQLMPATAAELGVDPSNPAENIDGGTRYLAQQFANFGNWNDALAAYNAGAANITAGQGYAANVLAGAQALGFSG